MHIAPRTTDLRPMPALCSSSGLSLAEGLGPLGPRAVVVRACKDEEVVSQDARAEYCFIVVSGCLRTVRLMEDGRRHVGEFLLSGDVFGWEALDRHDFAAEAVTPVVLHRYRRADLDRHTERDGEFARQMRALTCQRLRAVREQMLLLGRMTASERIAHFLLEMAGRLESDGGAWIELPMARADIADYLGLTVETVCRQLTHLRHDGTIAVQGMKVTIRDRRSLEAVDRAGVLH